MHRFAISKPVAQLRIGVPMARHPRFFLGERMTGPGEYRLDARESHHAAHVLRLGPGDAVVVSDGGGTYAEATVSLIRHGEVRVRAEEVRFEGRLPLFLTIAACIPKGKRWQALVEKCTELGADRIVPLICARSVARGEGDAGKWRRWAVEAAKQAGRSWLPEVRGPQTIAETVAEGKMEEAFFVIADPDGVNPGRLPEQARRARRMVAVIGPEGGFSESEGDFLARQGGCAVSLSPFVLRIETAASAACAILRSELVGELADRIDSRGKKAMAGSLLPGLE